MELPISGTPSIEKAGQPRCPLVALNRRANRSDECPLLGGKSDIHQPLLTNLSLTRPSLVLSLWNGDPNNPTIAALAAINDKSILDQLHHRLGNIGIHIGTDAVVCGCLSLSCHLPFTFMVILTCAALRRVGSVMGEPATKGCEMRQKCQIVRSGDQSDSTIRDRQNGSPDFSQQISMRYPPFLTYDTCDRSRKFLVRVGVTASADLNHLAIGSHSRESFVHSVPWDLRNGGDLAGAKQVRCFPKCSEDASARV